MADKLVNNSHRKTSILTTQVSNLAAQTLYTSLGWVVVKENFIPSPTDEPYVIMGKVLRGDRFYE